MWSGGGPAVTPVRTGESIRRFQRHSREGAGRRVPTCLLRPSASAVGRPGCSVSGWQGGPGQQQGSPGSGLPAPSAALVRAARASPRSQLGGFAFLLFPGEEARLQGGPASCARVPRGLSPSAVSGPQSVTPRARSLALGPRWRVSPTVGLCGSRERAWLTRACDPRLSLTPGAGRPAERMPASFVLKLRDARSREDVRPHGRATFGQSSVPCASARRRSWSAPLCGGRNRGTEQGVMAQGHTALKGQSRSRHLGRRAWGPRSAPGQWACDIGPAAGEHEGRGLQLSRLLPRSSRFSVQWPITPDAVTSERGPQGPACFSRAQLGLRPGVASFSGDLSPVSFPFLDAA